LTPVYVLTIDLQCHLFILESFIKCPPLQKNGILDDVTYDIIPA